MKFAEPTAIYGALLKELTGEIQNNSTTALEKLNQHLLDNDNSQNEKRRSKKQEKKNKSKIHQINFSNRTESNSTLKTKDIFILPMPCRFDRRTRRSSNKKTSHFIQYLRLAHPKKRSCNYWHLKHIRSSRNRFEKNWQ